MIAALATIWGSLEKPSADIHADATYNHVYYPPGITDLFNQAHDALILRPDSSFGELKRKAYEDYGGAWRITVSNSGNRTADSVVMKVPNAAYVGIDYEGREPTSRPVQEGFIELGSIRPDEKVELVVWQGRYTFTQPGDLSLSYASGRGSIHFQHYVARPFEWLDDHRFVSFWLGMVLAITLISVAGSIGTAIYRQVTGAKNETNDTEQQDEGEPEPETV